MGKTINNILKISKVPKTCHERFLDLKLDCALYFRKESVCFSGTSKLKRGYQVGSPEPSREHMIIITVAGNGLLLTPESEYRLNADTLICVPAGNPCMWRPLRNKWDIIWFYIKPVEKWNRLSEKGIQCYKTESAPELEACMERYLDESTNNSPFSREAAEHYAALTVLNLKRALKESSENMADEKTKRMDLLMQKIRNDPSDEWSAKNMAEFMNMSQATLQRVSRKLYGTSPKQLVINIKMEQAKLLLSSTGYPLKIIADKLDYSDEFVFSNAFKQKFGIPPKDFRLKNRKS